jgi:elongation factor Ts
VSTPTISASQVKELREETGAGMMECKRALQEAGGDMDKAVEALRVSGAAKAAKRGERAASEGTVQSYIHANNKVGVLVEVDCETDFVARNEDFIAFARDIALHVAATNPVAVADDDVPADERERERRIAAEQAEASGKPANVVEKIVEGKVNKWMDEVVLLRQQHVNQDKHEGRTIEQLRADLSAKTGENVVIRRFQRFAIGE